MALTIFSQYIRFMSLIREHSRLPGLGSDLEFCLCGNCRHTVFVVVVVVVVVFFFIARG